MMHDRAGQLTFQAYSADGSKAINSISRHGLNAVLLDAAEKEPTVTVCFEARAVVAQPDSGELTLDTPSGPRTTTHDVIIGADGAFSAVREPIVRTASSLDSGSMTRPFLITTSNTPDCAWTAGATNRAAAMTTSTQQRMSELPKRTGTSTS